MNINEISKENRPRERLIRYGAEELTDSELLAIILQSGTKKENAIDLSNRILNLGNLHNISINDLMGINGIGYSKASKIIAMIEFSKRIKKKEYEEVTCAEDVFYLYENMKYKNKEEFFILILNSSNKIVAEKKISVGILNAIVIHPREVFREAIKENACSIILMHNHPSGNPLPSKEDIEVTDQLIKVGKLLNIPVLDHIIIGDEYYSFSEKN